MKNFDNQADTSIVIERTHMMVGENEWKLETGREGAIHVSCHYQEFRLHEKGGGGVMKSGRN